MRMPAPRPYGRIQVPDLLEVSQAFKPWSRQMTTNALEVWARSLDSLRRELFGQVARARAHSRNGRHRECRMLLSEVMGRLEAASFILPSTTTTTSPAGSLPAGDKD